MHKYNVIPIFFLLEVDKVITKVHMEKYTYKQNIEKEELESWLTYQTLKLTIKPL